jgi:cell division protein FtsB
MFTPQKFLFGLVGAGAVILNLGILRGESSIENYFELNESKKILLKTVENLEKENEVLNEEIMKLKESPSYARKVLRDKYHVTEPDEDIMFFVE